MPRIRAAERNPRARRYRFDLRDAHTLIYGPDEIRGGSTRLDG